MIANNFLRRGCAGVALLTFLARSLQTAEHCHAPKEATNIHASLSKLPDPCAKLPATYY